MEIKALKNNGVRVSLIAKILHKTEGVALSTTYYHLSDNRTAYDNQAKKIRHYQKQRIQERIKHLIDQGYNTGTIAKDWNIPLEVLNKIYTT